MGIYLEDWENGDEDNVFNDFRVPLSEQEDVEIIFAIYTYENYQGEAFVLFSKCGTLYEVNAYHCSCYGLENQWEPEETTMNALEVRDWSEFGITFQDIKQAMENY